jgi:hypothetical protein
LEDRHVVDDDDDNDDDDDDDDDHDGDDNNDSKGKLGERYVDGVGWGGRRKKGF